MPFSDSQKAREAAMRAVEARRAKAAASEKAKIQRAMSQGIGESRVFVQDGDRDPYGSLRGLHIGGRPIEEVVPPDRIHLYSRWHTDEGIAERNAERTGPSASITTSEFDKMMQRRAEVWSAPDVLTETAQPHIEKGFRARYLSPRVVQRSGMRGWEIVTRNGDPVKLGNLMLARMPEEEAERRNEYYRSQGEYQAARKSAEFQEEAERLNREAGGMGISVPGPGTVLKDARTNRRVATGVTSHRGNTNEE